MSETAYLIYCPCSAEKASEVAKSLLEKKLAACVNIVPGIQSMYLWNGTLESSEEVVLLVKAPAHLAEQCAKKLAEIHPYDVPCVMTLDATANVPFARWMGRETDLPG